MGEKSKKEWEEWKDIGRRIEKMVKEAEAEERDAPQYPISPELYERHDYLVFYFDNEFDWNVACEQFGVEKVRDTRRGSSTMTEKQTGLGRVLKGSDLIRRVKDDR